MANPHQVFRRNSSWRKNIIRSLVTNIIINGRVETTLTRAKEARRFVEKMITKAKNPTLANRRAVASFLWDIKNKDGISADKFLFDTVAKKYKDRNGGYTRIIKLPQRQGDGASMAILELV